jgi:branched-chain amino acid transport system permease protein
VVRKRHFAVLLLAGLAIAYGSIHLKSYYVHIFYDVCINVVLAVSLNLVNGYTGQFSLAHAGFMAVGAYVCAYCTTTLFHTVGGVAEQAVFFGGLLAAGAAAAVVGFLVGAPSLRLRGDYLAIVTLGFGEIIRVILENFDSMGGPRGFSVSAGASSTRWMLGFWAFGSAVTAAYAVLALVHSTYGRGFLAVRDDEVAAEAMGINTTRYKIAAFVIGAFFAGIGGGLYARAKQFINPDGFDFLKSIEIVVMVILGGMGNTAGVILAAVVLTVLPEALRSLESYRMIIYSALLIVIMLARPDGLFNFRGWRRAKGAR